MWGALGGRMICAGGLSFDLEWWGSVIFFEKPSMKIVWKKKGDGSGGKKRARPIPLSPSLPFGKEEEEDESNPIGGEAPSTDSQADEKQLAESFLSQGNQLAEAGMYSEALAKWEAAIALMPEKATLHEQKAQVLLELGDAWKALTAATRNNRSLYFAGFVMRFNSAALLLAVCDVSCYKTEAWITLGRAQLNFGEPDLAIESFDKALAIQPNHEEALVDWGTAAHLVKRRKQLNLSNPSTNKSCYKVGDKLECPSEHNFKLEDERPMEMTP